MAIELIRRGAPVQDDIICAAIRHDAGRICKVLLRGIIKQDCCTKERLQNFMDFAGAQKKSVAEKELKKLMKCFS